LQRQARSCRARMLAAEMSLSVQVTPQPKMKASPACRRANR
jgi:hypothetical protein